MADGVNESLKMLFSKMEEFISTKTVVGEPVRFGDVTLVPLVDVTFGVGVGSGDDGKPDRGSGGGGGLGAKLSPSSVIVIANGAAQLISVKNQDSANKLIDMIPGLLAKVNWSSLFKKKTKEDGAGSDAPAAFPDVTVAEELRTQ